MCGIVFAATAIGASGTSGCWLTASFGTLADDDGGGDFSFDGRPPGEASSGDDGATGGDDGAPGDDTGNGPADVVLSDVVLPDGGPLTCVTATSYTQSVAADAPLAYWRLDDPALSTTAVDATGHGNAGTYAGTVTKGVAGAIANDPDTAVTLDGTSGRIEVGSKFPFLGKAPFTLEAWIKPAVLDGEYRGVVSNESSTPSGRQGYLVYVQQTQGSGFERWADNASDPTVVAGVVQTGRWFHVVGTFDGNLLTYYVNGVQRSTHVGDISIVAQTSSFMIGTLLSETSGSNFAGTIDEVAVYDHALSARCVLAHYNIGIGQPP